MDLSMEEKAMQANRLRAELIAFKRAKGLKRKNPEIIHPAAGSSFVGFKGRKYVIGKDGSHKRLG